MDKIKILISHNNNDIKKEIKNTLKKIEYIDIVDEVSTGKEVLDAILKYEPNIVFTKYDMKDISILSVIQIVSRALQEKEPIIKFISNNLSKTINANYEVEDDIDKILCFETTVNIKELGINDIVKTIQEYYIEKIRENV